ncbi:MAG: element excision factor XisH family protein [Saprospiraceae bacterium]
MARGIFHQNVREALEKDGWTITHDPLILQAGERKVRVDLGAERLIVAEKGAEKIAVEIKSFLDDSILTDFHRALGQSILYLFAIEKSKTDRVLFTAIPSDAFEELMSDEFYIELSRRENIRYLVFDPLKNVIVKWIK